MDIHVSTDTQWIWRVLRTVLAWLVIFPVIALAVGGWWCLAAVVGFELLVVGLVWRAVRR